MIYEAFAILGNQLEQFIRFNSTIVSSDPEVVIGNISLAEAPLVSESLKDKIVLSLVKTEEESALKNGQTRFAEGGSYIKQNRPVFTSLYVLITANYPTSYTNALKRIGTVIKFFQGKRVFNLANSPLPEIEGVEGITEFNMSIELVSLSLEEQNHMWGMMGGKNHPSALYKARVVALKRDAVQGVEIPITEIVIKENL